MAKLVGMKNLLGAACALATLLLTPAVAQADDDVTPQPVVAQGTGSVDTVQLRSGVIIQGRITELIGGDHITLVVAQGVTQSVAWAEVERLIISKDSFPAKARPPIPPPLPPVVYTPPHPPPPPAMVGPFVRVHIKASGTAYLYRRAEGTADYVTVCESPCDAEMPLSDSYKLGGSGFKTTEPFKLHGHPGDTVRLNIEGASVLGVVGGSAVAFAGTMALGVGSDDDHGKGNAVVALLGLVGMGLGSLIIYKSFQTDFSQETSRGDGVGAVRKPTWRSTSSNERAAPATFPVVYEGRF